MNTKTKILTVILMVMVCGIFLFPQKKLKIKDLPAHHVSFLELSSYIITDEEEDVFMQLTSELDRDIFIESFWKLRDPTPGTPENEYKDEIIDRFNYANRYLGRESTREGWRTDRGMMYIILGPPASKESFVEAKGVYPTWVWYYYGGGKAGLPTHFAVVFFQRGGFGEFKLYDPMSDGPSSILIDAKRMDPFEYDKLYEEILKIAPTLAGVTISLIPGEIPFNFTPTPRNATLIRDIMESPKKDINPTYATHFMDYKGLVSTDYMTNYVECDSHMALMPDPVTGLNFVHFSLAPNDVSVDYYEPRDQYYCNFILDVSLRRGEQIIVQYSKTIPFYFPAEGVKTISANGIAVEDSFPVAEGNFDLVILLRNTVGKEFTVVERKIEVRDHMAGPPQVIGPFVGYQINTYDQAIHLPYKILDQKLVVDPKEIFASKDDVSLLFLLSNIDQKIWEDGKAIIEVKGSKELNPSEKTYTLRLSNFPLRSIISMTHTIPAAELSPDYYAINLNLVSEGRTIASQTGHFIITTEEAIGHPIINVKGVPSSNNYILFYMLASQYSVINNLEKAESYYQRAFQMNPQFSRGILDYVQFLLKAEKYEQGLELIEGIKEEPRLRFDYYFIKGKLHMGSGSYDQAIESLEEGNKIYNSHIGLLNELGICYYRIDETQKALEVFKASLQLNSNQPEIQELVKKLERNDF
jgi:GWxTD domain-containing protein